MSKSGFPKRFSGFNKFRAQIESGQAYVYFIENGVQRYALKRLKNVKRANRFRVEVETIRMLYDEGLAVVEVIDSNSNRETSEIAPYFWYLMPYMEEGTLNELISNGGSGYELRDLIRMYVGLMDTLDQIHSLGKIHRDIKPGNIFIYNGTFVLADFGICYSGVSDRQTDTVEQLGSRHWQAPELLNGRMDHPTVSCDYFSMGKVLYYLITGDVLKGIGPYFEKDILYNGQYSSILKRSILVLTSFDSDSRSKLWPNVKEALNKIVEKDVDSEEEIPKEYKIINSVQRMRERAGDELEGAKRKRELEEASRELKSHFVRKWTSMPVIVHLQETLAPMVRFNTTAYNFTSVKWMIQDKIVADSDNDSNAVMRFQPQELIIRQIPIAVVSIIISEREESLRVLTGCGVRDLDDNQLREHGPLPPLKKEDFWELKMHYKDPLLHDEIDKISSMVADRWIDYTLSLVENSWGK